MSTPKANSGGSSVALLAASHGIDTALKIKNAFDEQVQAKFLSLGLEKQMQEIEARTQMQIQNIYKQSDKIVAQQEAAFISGGVELSGSAMSVISDTINNAAEASYIRQREADYELLGIAMKKSQYDSMASNETLLFSLAAAGIGGTAGVATDMYKLNRSSTRDRGASGIGAGGPQTAGDY
jgi:hypothetical protein